MTPMLKTKAIPSTRYSRPVLLNVAVPLIAGLSIYLLFRHSPLALLADARIPRISWSGSMPRWLVYNLPSGLWAYSMVSAISILWINQRAQQRAAWLAGATIVAISMELSQLMLVIPGTYDHIDVVLTVLGCIFAYSFVNKRSIG